MRSRTEEARRGLGGRRVGAVAVVATAMSTACGGALPVLHVVVYRNGIAYFERGGHVDRSEVQFKMMGGAVSDFLATLAVTDRAGSSVRSAAFPIQAVDVVDRGEDRADHAKDVETVVLTLDGHAHDLVVGYIGQSPVWKPSYRLLLRAGGGANLQLWGIVQNFSGEDWKNVKLSLVAGAPIAFQSDLRTPVVPWRPIVTDRGDPTIPIPRSETSYGQTQRTQMDQAMASTQVASATSVGKGDADVRARRRQVGLMEGAAFVPPAGSASLGVSVRGGSTRYDVAAPVTIPDESASMVMVLDRSVPGEMLLLFAPDGATPESADHPYRAARFVNDTGGALEPGPMAVFEDGAFLSQAVTDPIPAGASGTIPFALEHAVTVDHDVAAYEHSGELENNGVGELTVARYHVTRTTYRLRNESSESVKVLVKHPRLAQTKLFDPPSGTEDSIGLGTALVPATVPAHAAAELVVEERAPVGSAVDWSVPAADAAVKAYIADPRSDRDTVRKLAAVWAQRADIVKLVDERNSLRQRSYDLTQASGSRPETSGKVAVFEHQIADLEGKISALTAHFNLAMGEISAGNALPARPAR